MQPETAPAQTSMMTCANFTKSAEEPNSRERRRAGYEVGNMGTSVGHETSAWKLFCEDRELASEGTKVTNE
jgi:hypothetical protein